jgi:hypothetical protein
MEQTKEEKKPSGEGFKWRKSLLPHERELFDSGNLQDTTHPGATAIYLEAPSSIPPSGKTNVYRPMGDLEISYLVQNKQLPDTQPYQAIIEGEEGRAYSDKYLSGKKWTNTSPSTIVEFTAPIELIETLKKKQMKIEDGAMSMGLGSKAGKGLPLFNASMKNGETTFRIVKVKRKKEK